MLQDEVTFEVKERNDLLKWGDRSRFGILYCDGNPTGNMIGVRKGRVSMFVLISGAYFDDRDDIREFLGPKLELLENYKP